MLRSELGLTFGRMRTRGLLLVVAAIPALLALAVRLSGGPDGGHGPTFLDQVSRNGVFAALAGLTVVIPFFLPLAVSVVAGDTIAGEASLGTLRYLLVRPVGRTRLILSKFVTAVVFCLVSALAVALTGLLVGWALFPVGSVVTLSGTTIGAWDGIYRSLGAATLVGASMIGLVSIGVLISTFTESPVGAIAATAGIAILSQILGAIPQLDSIHFLLFTQEWMSFGDLMRTPVMWDNIIENLILQACWTSVFLLAAWARMTTRDVLG
ncbi:MAG: ABC transporter permease subunit [Acidimicrobiia bacterium]|nr:ABC transporter permease subunit [Acidimicrobiia bacterium]